MGKLYYVQIFGYYLRPAKGRTKNENDGEREREKRRGWREREEQMKHKGNQTSLIVVEKRGRGIYEEVAEREILNWLGKK